MIRAIAIILRLLSITLLLMLLSCSLNSDEIAGKGTGSETPNTLTGIVQDSLGNPSEGVLVKLNPSTFNPVREELPDSLKTTTNSKGIYSFKISGRSSYNLEAINSVDNTVGLLRGIETPKKGGDSLMIDTAQLHTPGTIIIQLNKGEMEEGGYIYIPGTDLYVKIGQKDMDRGFVEFSGVPSSRYSDISYTNSDFNFESQIAPLGLDVPSGGTVVKGPYYAWKNRAEIRINTTADGAAVAEDAVDFPLLLRLDNSSGLFAGSSSDGKDLRFTKSDGLTNLPYELEKWDVINNVGVVWVRIDTLYGNSMDQYIIAYTGASDVVSESSGSAVFDSSLGYAGVWHFEPDDSGDMTRVPNSAYNANHGTFVDPDQNRTNDLNSVISTGVDFSGLNQFVSTSRYFDAPMVFAISCWFNSNTSSGGKLLDFNNNALGKPDKDRHVWMDDTGVLYFGVYPPAPDVIAPEDSGLVAGSGIFRTIKSLLSYNDGNWHYAMATLSASGMRLFVDGKKVAENPDVTEAQHFQGVWQIGYGLMSTWKPLPSSNYFGGRLDEVRVFYGNVSEDRVKLEFENQKASSSMVVVKGSN